MSDTLPDRLKKLAILYALGDLPAEKASRFEIKMETSPALKKLTEELKTSLEMTRKMEKSEPPETFLIHQRNLLRARIEALETFTAPRSIWEGLKNIPDRVFQVVTLQSQPVLAAVSYLVLGLVIGRFLLPPGTPSLSPEMPAASVEERIKAIIARGELAATRIEPVSNGSDRITFRLKAEDDLTYTGGAQERVVKELLYYLLLNESNPGRRLQSIKLISHFDEDDQGKMVLVAAVLSDENPGVRLRAIKNLASYPVDKTLRNASVKLLLEDENMAIRMEALKILTRNPDQRLVPILQAVTRLDDNPYIRSRAASLLETVVTAGDDFTGNRDQ